MERPDNLEEDYRRFFMKAEGGKYFIQYLHEQIDSEHEKAEKNPELARDHTQRAKGVRQLLEHIQSVTAEDKT